MADVIEVIDPILEPVFPEEILVVEEAPRSTEHEERKARMTLKTKMNGRTTDAVSQVGTQVVGVAPSLATGQSLLSMAQATGLAFQNAVAAQQQVALTQGTSAVKGTSFLLGIHGTTAPQGTTQAAVLDVDSALAVLRLALGLSRK